MSDFLEFEDLPSTDTPINATNLNHNTGAFALLIGTKTDTWSSSSTYNVGDIICYKYKLYENKTGNNTSTAPNLDTTNWEETSILV